MAVNPIPNPLAADLPENWVANQTIAPSGENVGLPTQYGYNYLMAKVNEAVIAINTLNAGFGDIPGGFIEMESELPVLDRTPDTLYGLVLANFGGGES